MKLALYFVFLTVITFVPVVRAQRANELTGLWEAKKRFGPDVKGTLAIIQKGDRWRAEIAGLTIAPKIDGDRISFEFPGGNGRFAGKFVSKRTAIEGHWFQAAASFTSGIPYASPVRLVKAGSEYRGDVVPTDEALTFYLHVKERPDGTVGAFIRNHERNLGRFIRVDRLERDGNSIKFLGAPTATDKNGRLWAEGTFANDIITINIANRGGNYDFRRVDPDRFTDFYSRGRPGVIYKYEKPPQLDDGWPTATLEDVGLSREGIEKFIQSIIDAPVDSLASQQDHGILIVRHGKLVVEEYFHGEHREKAHDTRSASKSIASDLVGAAQFSGVKIDASTPVYSTMNDGVVPEDARQRAMKLEHLLSMSNGLDCNDDDDNSPGFEDKMWGQTEQPNFYKWTMSLKMVNDPGSKFFYCSASPNLAGGMIAKLAKRSGLELFDELIAKPLEIKRYYATTGPLGEYTLTGGWKFYPRDFMKLAQVHINGGTWKGRRIYSAEWSRRATTAVFDTPDVKYAYLWWISDYEYKGRKIRAYMASGNGGQFAVAIPDLDLVLGFWAGNYNDRGGFTAIRTYIPQFILPAVVK